MPALAQVGAALIDEAQAGLVREWHEPIDATPEAGAERRRRRPARWPMGRRGPRDRNCCASLCQSQVLFVHTTGVPLEKPTIVPHVFTPRASASPLPYDGNMCTAPETEY